MASRDDEAAALGCGCLMFAVLIPLAALSVGVAWRLFRWSAGL